MKSTIIFLILSLLILTSCSNTRWTNVVPKIHLDPPSHKTRSWIVKNAPLYVKKDVAECIRGSRTLERIEEDSSITDVKFDSYWAKGLAVLAGIGTWFYTKLVWIFSFIV